MKSEVKILRVQLDRSKSEFDRVVKDFCRQMDDADQRIRILRDALEGMVDAHMDECRDDRDEICVECVMALLALRDTLAGSAGR